MAAPIAHIFLAKQMLAGPFKGFFDEKEFIIGTSFPDIRYLKVVPRTKTHIAHILLKDILLETNSFKAGVLFHSLVDEQREAFVVANRLYDKMPEFRFTSQSLKFAEDELLKNRFDIAYYQSYFDTVLDREKDYNIDEKHIAMWHTFLQEYFNGDYSGKDLFMKYFDLNEPNAWFIKRWFFARFYARKMHQAMAAVLNNEQTKKLILDFYLHFAERNAHGNLSRSASSGHGSSNGRCCGG
jgi:hypothetical protein